MTVSAISTHFNMAMSSISKHLVVLKQAGLVQEQKRGQFALYSLDANDMANLLYGSLKPFCQDARKIVKARKMTPDNAGGRS